MPLSEHEQRLLEQIERALVDDDPKFASSVRTGDRRLKARRKLQIGVGLVVVGFAVLVGGDADISRALCARIRDLRKKRGWTLEELSAAFPLYAPKRPRAGSDGMRRVRAASPVGAHR